MGCCWIVADRLTGDRLKHQADFLWGHTSVSCWWFVKVAEDCLAWLVLLSSDRTSSGSLAAVLLQGTNLVSTGSTPTSSFKTFSKHLICILICKQDLDTCVKSGLQYICFQSENNSWSPQDKFYWHFTEGHHEVHKMWASWCELPFVNCLNNCGMDCHDIWSGQELSRYINIDDNCDVCYNKQMIILCKLCSTS